MTKVYPNAATAASIHTTHKLKHFPVDTIQNYNNDSSLGSGKTALLTAWKKSLLFNCDGFTVFDGNGNLVFRVDNYLAATKAEIILMDASGNSLLTIRPKRLSLLDNWFIYKGETMVNPVLSVRKHVNLLNTKSLAHATIITNGTNSSSKTDARTKVIYEIEGSYTRRCCTIYNEKREVVAEIKPKEPTTRGVAFGLDVFRLIVHPEMNSDIAMALIIVLDQMFGSSKRLHFK